MMLHFHNISGCGTMLSYQSYIGDRCSRYAGLGKILINSIEICVQSGAFYFTFWSLLSCIMCNV